MEAQTVFPTKPLLRPDQVTNAKDEIKGLEAKLTNKHIEDKAEVARQLRRARQDFETQVPRAPETPEEEGRMVKRSRELLSQILVGMPSQEEMRKAPPGAINKHLEWERRNKAKILEWKYINLRLTAGSNDREAANLEKHRPTGSTLNMDNAQIPGKQFFMPETTSPAVVFSDDQISLIRVLDPALADRLSTLSNPQRQIVKEALGGIGLEAPSPASVAGKEGAARKAAKRVLSQEQKDKMQAGRKAAAARKAK